MPAMRRRILLGLAASTCLSGCVAPYQPPTQAEPHATIKVRRTYGADAGTTLSERVEIGGHPAFQTTTASADAKAPRVDVILAHPGVAEFRVRTSFFHQEMRMVSESYRVQTPYTTTESYNCGSGSNFR